MYVCILIVKRQVNFYLTIKVYGTIFIIQLWKALKSEAKIENALRNKAGRRTGNELDGHYQVDEKYQRILNLEGNNHNHSLAIVPEFGSPFKKGKKIHFYLKFMYF